MKFQYSSVLKRVRFTAVTLICFLFLYTGLRAEEPAYARLVNSKTTAMVRVDCNQLNFTNIMRSLLKKGDEAVDVFISNPDTAKQVRAGLPLMVMAQLSCLNTLFDAMKEAELCEIYLVATPGVEESPGYIAIPVGDKTKEELSEVLKAVTGLRSLNLPVDLAFVRNGFIFAPLIFAKLTDEQLKSFVRAQFGEIKSEPRPDIEKAVGEFPYAGITVVLAGTEETEGAFAQTFGAVMGKMQETAKALGQKSKAAFIVSLVQCVNQIAQQTSYTVAAVDQSDSSVKIRIRLENDGHGLQEQFDAVRETGAKLAEDTDDPRQKEIPGFLELAIPAVESGTLDWKFDEQLFSNHKEFFRRLAQAQKAKQDADAEAENEEAPNELSQ